MNSISESDARYEGIGIIRRSLTLHGRMDGMGISGCKPEDSVSTAVAAYQQLYDSINGAGAFACGEWVWTYDIARIKKPK